MVDKNVIKNYIATIGIECHVQLKTKTKLFSAVGNDAREAPANTLISHIDLGMPGALPVLNAAAINLASKAAFALGTEPQKFSKFDRKHYFYPDLPKGYQITQFDQPIIIGGFVDIVVDNQKKRINLTRAHLEEDAGKSTHLAGKDYSLVDLNRAGTPLLEIVSEPEMHSAAEAKAYAKALYLLMKYADVSDANLFYGNMRFDVNVSVSKTSELGTRTETKNLNSFKSVEKAVEYEIARQIEVLEKGQKIVQETRGWDDAKQKTFSQRSKEDAHDYRYFPDPDIPPVVLDDEYVKNIKAEMPKMPEIFRTEFSQLGLDTSAIDVLISSPESATFVSHVLDGYGKEHARRISHWLVHSYELLIGGKLGGTTGKAITAETAIQLSEMVEKNELSSTAAKEIWAEMMKNGGDPRKIAEHKNMLQISDESAIAEIVAKVLTDNPEAAKDVKEGETKAIGFLVGQVMKESKGQANPGLAQKLIKEKLVN